jgi:exonuclease III
MPQVYKLATVNINGITPSTRHAMLAEFIYKQDLDIILLQEVTNQNITMVQRYIAYTNLVTEGRGMVILTKDGLQVEQVKC